MMKLDNITKNIVGEYIYLSWEDAPSDAVSFNIYYSLNEVISNDWNELGSTSNNYFSDYINFRHSILNQRITYKIEAVDIGDNILDNLIINTDTQDEELLSRTLNVLSRDAEIALRNNQWSRDAFILKPRKSGVFCSCYSQDLRASAKPTCTDCYGKGYIGGFYDPMHSFAIVLEEQVKRRTVNEKKPTSYDVVTAVMPSFPQVVEDDYVYLKNIGIFQVMRSTTNSVLGSHTPTSLITMSLLKPNNVIYNYPLVDVITTVTNITQDGVDRNKFYVNGDNLIPYFGEFKLILSNQTDLSEYGVYLFDSVDEITNEKITITTDLSEEILTYKYRLRLNGIIFEGII